MKIGVIDIELGNIGSVLNIVERVNGKAFLVTNPNDLKKYDKLVLPGVGAFDKAVTALLDNDWIDALNNRVIIEKTPFLGICLGMQLLTRKSEEGRQPGFGWIAADTVRFDERRTEGGKLKIPHMGWNLVDVKKNSDLFDELDSEQRFYFVHSYHVLCDNQEDVLATTSHGYEFVSAIEHENIVGVQFHPEKSHRFGIQLFRNFLKKF
jgi:glutamine amidotransferase